MPRSGSPCAVAAWSEPGSVATEAQSAVDATGAPSPGCETRPSPLTTTTRSSYAVAAASPLHHRRSSDPVSPYVVAVSGRPLLACSTPPCLVSSVARGTEVLLHQRAARFIQPRCGRVICPKNLSQPFPAAVMKIEKANAGVLTNFEVLDFLRLRGAKTDPMGCLGAVAASECKVYEYLLKTPACNQTRETIYEFVKRSEGFRLAEADKLNVINWRPSSPADAYAMIEECGRRFSRDERGEACDEEKRVQKFLDMVKEVLPPPPPKAEAME